MILSVQKRKFRRSGKLCQTRAYYLRYRIGDMPVDKWKSLGVKDKQVADKKAGEFIHELEREAAGILAPKVARDAAQKPLLEHLADYEADLVMRNRAGRGGRGARQIKSRITKLFEDNRCFVWHPSTIPQKRAITILIDAMDFRPYFSPCRRQGALFDILRIPAVVLTGQQARQR